MLNRDDIKPKLILLAIFGALGGALILGFVLYQHRFEWLGSSLDKTSAQGRVLDFLERAGWKPQGEKVIVEKVGDNLGAARAVLLYKSNEGVSVPGMLFLVGRQYVLIGRLFDSQTGKDLSPGLFGKLPIRFDVNRLNLSNAHKRGSDHPKVVIVEYGDYGCQSCAKLEKVLQPLLDNFPQVQHVYKHYPLSDGSRYLAEVAEAVSQFGERDFWELHKRIFAADKSEWDQKTTERFVATQLKELGLDPQQIRLAVESGEPGKRVSRNQTEFPVSETPTLIINGEVVVGALGYGELKTIVEEKLKGQAK